MTWTAKGKPILPLAPSSLLFVCLKWTEQHPSSWSFLPLIFSQHFFSTSNRIAIFQTRARKFLMPSQFTDSISAIMLHCNRRRKPGQCLDNFSNFEDVCSVCTKFENQQQKNRKIEYKIVKMKGVFAPVYFHVIFSMKIKIML